MSAENDFPMDRRTAMATLGGLALAGSGVSGAEPAKLPDFWKSRVADVEAAVRQVNKGSTRVLAQSPGKRNVHLVTYGPKQERQGRANYNSACGGRDPASYALKDGEQRPVVFLLGPVHGAEFEGIVGLLNLMHIAETGSDLRGQEWASLTEHLQKCRVLIVPCANPDGRARCAYDSWVGEELSTNEPVGMGQRPDGSNYKWPHVKQVHPMRAGDYSKLGAYFNDAGVNLMHDEWFSPMSVETKTFLDLARAESPDYIVSLHSHAATPSLEPVHYVPRTVKVVVKELGDRIQRSYADAGLPHRKSGGPEPVEDGLTFPPPAFNLNSAMHHVSGAVAFTHECCLGVKTPPYPSLTHANILDLELLFFEELFRYAVEHPVSWVK